MRSTSSSERRASRPRQLLLALVTVALDGVACFFAAQALGGAQSGTLVWTALFLAVLGRDEASLHAAVQTADRRRGEDALGCAAESTVEGAPAGFTAIDTDVFQPSCTFACHSGGDFAAGGLDMVQCPTRAVRRRSRRCWPARCN